MGWGLPLTVLIAGMFMSILDTTIVNVAIPTIQNEFGVSTDDVQWVVTGYTLALGVVVPVTAWLGDRFGLKRVYNLALLAFAAGSALCGLAWDLNSLVAFRIFQAIPGGILPVITLSILYRIVPRDRLGVAMGLYGLGIVCAPAIGPTLVVPGRVRELAADLRHQRAHRHSGCAGRGASVAALPHDRRTPIRRAGLRHRGRRALRVAAGGRRASPGGGAPTGSWV